MGRRGGIFQKACRFFWKNSPVPSNGPDATGFGFAANGGLFLMEDFFAIF
jgi:hypothetical protein